MNESSALDVMAVRAVESADTGREICSDADRAWASHNAAAAVGESAAPELFLARRAQLLLARLSDHQPSLQRAVAALRWRSWLAYVLPLLAFLVGLLVDRMAHAQHINVLAPPVLVFVLWNLLVYVVLLAGALLALRRIRRDGPLRRAVVYLGTRVLHVGTRRDGPLAAALANLVADWTRLTAALYGARAARILHLSAAAMATGIVAGMYVRGLGLEYRATWESTFLEPAAVHVLLATVLAPGAWLAGMPLPDLAQVAAIRAPGSENAAPWLHWFALTLLVLVIVPRSVLAMAAFWHEHHRARRLPVELAQPYFQRLLRGFHVAPTQVRVLPYGYTPSAPAAAGLRTLLARLLGGDADVEIRDPVAYGADEAALARALVNGSGPTVVVLNLASTPEQEAHTAFVAAVSRCLPSGQSLLVLVDETSFRARVGDGPQRLDERRGLWRDQLRSAGVTPVFAALADSGAQTDDATLEAAFYRRSD